MFCASPGGFSTLLSERLTLWDIQDSADFVERLVEKRWGSWGGFLLPDDREEVVCFMLALVWEISGLDANGKRKYGKGQVPDGIFDPDRGKSFKEYAGWVLPRRAVDWLRKWHGDSRYGLNVKREELDSDDRHAVAAIVGEGFDEILEAVNVKLLTPDGRDTLELIARPKAEEGKTYDQIAQELGWPKRRVTQLVADLVEELKEQAVAA